MRLFLIAAALGWLDLSARADLMLGPDHFIGESIKAHGGEKIDKYRGEIMKFKGKMPYQGKEIDAAGEQVIQFPGQNKTVVRFEADGKKYEFTSVINGDKGWTNINGVISDMDEQSVRLSKGTLHAYRVARMTQIPNDREFKLVNKNVASNPSNIDGVRAWGIQVSYPKENDVILWIADDKKLLLKLEITLQTDDKKTLKLEELFGDYKEVNGVQRPFKRTVFRDGKKTIETQATEIKLLEQIDDKEFAKP